MHSTLFLGTALFSAVALADISIDISKADEVASDFVAYVSSVTANPAFESDINAIASAIPSSVIAAAEKDPEAFAQAIFTATALPAWVSAIPTPALDSLETLAAKPIKAVEDVASYVGSEFTAAGFESVDSVLATAIPSSVIAQLESNPESFIEAQFTATGPPAYITALPQDVQSDIGSIINEGLSIIASDLEASSAVSISLPTKKPTKKPSYKASGTGVAKATGTGVAKASGTGVYYTGAAANTPLAFTGAASSVVVNTFGAGILAAFGIVLVLL